MKTDLADFVRDTEDGRLAESILRKCVHCGFCTATCPTYQLLGNELDGPRGRIYLIKQTLEGFTPTRRTQLHLDRCLTCRSCETTCPSGVDYSELLDIGRRVVDNKVGRSLFDQIKRKLLCVIVPRPSAFRVLLIVSQIFKVFLPRSIKSKIPPSESVNPWPKIRHPRKVILHQGCVQRVVKPQINTAAAMVLDANSISCLRLSDVCCGAVGLHNGDYEGAKDLARKNIDAWWPAIQEGVEAIVSTASGCGVTLKEYGKLLSGDTNYSAMAEKIATMTVDLSELSIDLPTKSDSRTGMRVAFHSPCTLQHGLQINGRVESILNNFGIETTSVRNSHLCCGSAGTYSLLQPKLSQQLLDDKLNCLNEGKPDAIVTANIGCLMHLQSKSKIPVKHWIELIPSE